MYQRLNATGPESLFLPMSRRKPGPGIYFVRIIRYDQKVKELIWRCHEQAAMRGVILDGDLPKPDDRQISYMKEQLGDAFIPNEVFIMQALAKWMPRMREDQRDHCAQSMADHLRELQRSGKPDTVLKNIYVKLMCWLYYRFDRLVPFLGQDQPPMVLYSNGGTFTRDELIMLRLLVDLGADVVMPQPDGDEAYLKQDPRGEYSQLLDLPGNDFPQEFNLKDLRKEMMAQSRSAAPARPTAAAPRPQPQGGARPAQPSRPGMSMPAANRPVPAPSHPAAQRIDLAARFPRPSRESCLNAWMKEASYEQILTPVLSRGNDSGFFYHALIRQTGVNDRVTFENELFTFHQKLKGTGRNILILEEGIPDATPEETQKIRRHGGYHSPQELILDLSVNLPPCANVELQKLLQYAFAQTMMEAAKAEPILNRLVSSAVILLCWVLRYQSQLFSGYKGAEIPVFILMGGCRTQREAMYISFLSRLPVDVLLLAPDLNAPCCFTSPELLELKGTETLALRRYPQAAGTRQIDTAASHASHDLDTMLYSGSGMYRSKQFAVGETITLRTTYDELFILWNQQLRYRSSFSTTDSTVNMPVLFASVAGVDKGDVPRYWHRIKELLTKDAVLIDRLPHIPAGNPNPFQQLAVKSIRDGRINRQHIMQDPKYPFALLRQDMQNHIMDKLQLMLDRRLIRGTMENGTEYTVVSTVLNMRKDFIRLLQAFDFTAINPKVVCISTDEQTASLEDAILLTFLNLVGFDVAIFVPTGYQTIERHLNDNLPVEHQAGDYVYDLRVPDFKTLPPLKRSFMDLFRRS